MPSLGLACPPGGLGPAPVPTAVCSGLCCLQGMSLLAGFFSVTLTPPLEASTMDRGQLQPLPGVQILLPGPEDPEDGLSIAQGLAIHPEW